jgi:hypothetical protein
MSAQGDAQDDGLEDAKMRQPSRSFPVLWTAMVLMCGLLLGVAGYMGWKLIEG